MSEERSSGLVRLVQESAPLRRKITASLRQAIELGTLKPGERLVEKDLCRDLNVSRTSLREAFRELEAEGLLTNQPRGLVVTQVTEQEANNIYRVRAALEALVAEQFAEGATEAAQSELKEAVDKLERAYAEKRYDLILSAKKEYYETLCRGANNLIVLDLLNRLNSRITQLRSASLSDPTRGVASMAEIRNLSAALLARDATAARAAAINHVESAAKYTANLRHIRSARVQQN
jgi:DNA-binding GntR family transcriptional regulator